MRNWPIIDFLSPSEESGETIVSCNRMEIGSIPVSFPRHTGSEASQRSLCSPSPDVLPLPDPGQVYVSRQHDRENRSAVSSLIIFPAPCVLFPRPIRSWGQHPDDQGILVEGFDNDVKRRNPVRTDISLQQSLIVRLRHLPEPESGSGIPAP